MKIRDYAHGLLCFMLMKQKAWPCRAEYDLPLGTT